MLSAEVVHRAMLQAHRKCPWDSWGLEVRTCLNMRTIRRAGHEAVNMIAGINFGTPEGVWNHAIRLNEFPGACAAAAASLSIHSHACVTEHQVCL